MTTERGFWFSTQPASGTTRHQSVCHCGQDLDDLHPEHCPRCGVDLTAPGRSFAHL